jgi:tellurite resistance protein
MPTTTTSDTNSLSPSALTSGIRDALARLATLDRDTAGYLKALAFILYRVAAADRDVSEEEVRRMESILVDHASLSRAEAVRARLDDGDRRRLRSFLESVAEADGEVRQTEKDAIRQISTELGLTG